LISLGLFAAESEGTNIYYMGFYEGATTYIYGNSVRVRTTAEIKDDNISDVLPTGYKVSIIKLMRSTYSQNGFSEYWYKVRYSKDKKDKEGFIWGGLLAIGYTVVGADLFIIGLVGYNGEEGFSGGCKLLRNGEVISYVPVMLHHLLMDGENPFYGYSVTVTLHDNLGLSGLKNVIAIYNDYSACGYPHGTVWIGLSKDKLHYLITDSSVDEAGVFHYSEKVIFPSRDKSLKDEVRLVIESFDFDEKINDYRLSDRKEKRFKWKDFSLKEVN